jgi:hypothetical protein
VQIGDVEIVDKINSKIFFTGDSITSLINRNEIKIIPLTLKDYDYAKSVLVYKILDSHPETYFFLKEYKR